MNYVWRVDGSGYDSNVVGWTPDMDPYNLYIIDYNRSGEAYYLSSPCSNTNYDMYGAGSYGGKGTAATFLTTNNGRGFRPVVHLKKGYKLQWNDITKKIDIVN